MRANEGNGKSVYAANRRYMRDMKKADPKKWAREMELMRTEKERRGRANRHGSTGPLLRHGIRLEAKCETTV